MTLDYKFVQISVGCVAWQNCCHLCLNVLLSPLYFSRSYAEDVTSVTSGTSQGPHSFNLVFVCLFVCLCHAWRYCVSVPYRTIKHSWPHTAGRTIQIGLSNARS